MRTTLALLLCCLLLGCRAAPSGKLPGIKAPDEDNSSDTDTEPGRKAQPTLGSIDYPAGKETLHGFLCRPEKTKRPSPGLILIHDANGLTGWTKDQAFRLSSRGYVVLAVDLYRGEMPKNLKGANLRDRGPPEERALGDLKAAMDYLAGRADVDPDALGAIGFGLGGGYALEAAVRDPRLRAVVNCYGRLITDPKRLAPLRATLFCVFAGKYEGNSMDAIDQFIQAMNKAGKTMPNPLFCPDCGYGFFDPANWPTYGKPKDAKVKDAWKQIDAFLDGQLKATGPRPRGGQPKQREEDG
ncbi:MAG TPA: dienelactone hydrolase family protein [Gemmataceae bacterium]|jgi:carboxymethylenebutenolidase